MSDDPRAFLESARIEWRRDWDALLVGWVIGALSAVIGSFALGAVEVICRAR